MAAVVIGIGFPSSLMFQLFIPEKRNANLEKLEWYKWLINPRFYLVSELFYYIMKPCHHVV